MTFPFDFDFEQLSILDAKRGILAPLKRSSARQVVFVNGLAQKKEDVIQEGRRLRILDDLEPQDTILVLHLAGGWSLKTVLAAFGALALGLLAGLKLPTDTCSPWGAARSTRAAS